MYNFVRTQLVKCPNVKGWYLKLEPEDNETLLKLHKMVTTANMLKAKKDPHLQAEIEKGSFLVALQHPIYLSARWLMGMESNVINKRTTLVNSCGGWMPLDDSVEIIESFVSETLEYPKESLSNDEIITISQWGDGKHYYLSSNKNRMMDKQNSLDSAKRIAYKYTNNVKVEEKRMQTKEGD